MNARIYWCPYLSADRETAEHVKCYRTTQKRIAILSRSIRWCSYSTKYFLLAHTPSCGIIHCFLPRESWSSHLLNLLDGIGVRAIFNILDGLSLRLTCATSPHINQAESCAECAVRMAQPLCDGIVRDAESWEKGCRSLRVFRESVCIVPAKLPCG